MIQVTVLHDDDRVRTLYRSLLDARGYPGMATAVSEPTPRSALTTCDLLLVQVPDGADGLAAVAPLIARSEVPVICIDDDPEPARERWFLDQGIDTVLTGPVALRDLVDAVDRLAATMTSSTSTPATGAWVVHDSAERSRRRDTRGRSRPRGHHQVLQVDGTGVALHSFPRTTGLRIVGDVTGPPEPILGIVVLDHAGGTTSSRTDPGGRFELHGVTPGTARLRIEARGWSIDVEVELGAR